MTSELIQSSVHFGSIKQVMFTPTGEEILTVGKDDNMLCPSMTEDLTNSKRLNMKDNNIAAICFHPTGSLLVGYKDNKLALMNWPECDDYHEIYEFNDKIRYICCNNDGSSIAVATKKSVELLLFNGYKCEFSKTICEIEKIKWIGIGTKRNSLFVMSQSNEGIKIYNIVEFSLISEGSGDEIKLTSRKITQESSSPVFPCFTYKSDLLVYDVSGNGILRSINYSNKKAQSEEGIFIIKEHEANISAVSSSIGTYISTIDTNGNLMISEFDHDKLIFEYPANKIQKLIPAQKLKINSSEKVVMMKWNEGNVALVDEGGNVYIYKNVVNISSKAPPKVKDVQKKKTGQANLFGMASTSSATKKSKPAAPKPKVAKPKAGMSDIMAQLSKPVESKKADYLDDDDSLDDLDDEEPKPRERSPIPEPISSKPKPKPKSTKSKSKPKSNNSLLTDSSEEMMEDIEDQQFLNDGNIESLPTFEEPEIDLESDTSSGHEIDIDPFREHKEEEEENELKEIVSANSDSDAEEDEMDLADLYPNMTFPFMPGSSETFMNNRRFMCWNAHGAVLLRDLKDGTTAIDIHGISTEDHMTNINNYKYATLDQFGFFCASETQIMYRHHKTWAPDNITTIEFPHKITLIASGDQWFAVATEEPTIHIFTSAGLEISVINLPITCTIMLGTPKYLFYAYGPMLEYRIISVLKLKEHAKGFISVKQPVRWIGATEDGNFVVQDYFNLIHRLYKDFSWKWIPVADFNTIADDDTTGFWPVKVDDSSIYFVPLRGTRTPTTYPIPSVHKIDMSPLTHDTRVRQWLINQMEYPLDKDKYRNKIDEQLLKMLPNEFSGDIHELRLYHIAQLIKTEAARKLVPKYYDAKGAFKVVDKLTGEDRKQKTTRVSFGESQVKQPAKKIRVLDRESSSESLVYVRPKELPPALTKTTLVTSTTTGLFDALKQIGEKAKSQVKEKNERKQISNQKISSKKGKSKKVQIDPTIMPIFGIVKSSK